jgi:hypothetical protein
MKLMIYLRVHWVLSLMVPVGLVGALLGGILWAQPALAALACPSCFGFVKISDHVFVDAAISHRQRAQLAAAMIDGERKVAAFYGVLRETPRILVCATDACSRRVGSAAAKGMSYAHIGLRLSPFGIDPVIVAHEESHIELHGRLGLLRFMSGAVPAWFDEGLAVIVSDDPRYLLVDAPGDRCRVEPIGDFPETTMDWLSAANTDQHLYARAACRVLRWMNSNGGKAAVLALIAKVTQGEAFTDLFHDRAPEGS